MLVNMNKFKINFIDVLNNKEGIKGRKKTKRQLRTSQTSLRKLKINL